MLKNRMKTKIIQDATLVLFVIVIAVSFVIALVVGLDKQEEVTCYKLQKQAETHQNFHLTPIEKRMCDYHGIIIDAPVQR